MKFRKNYDKSTNKPTINNLPSMTQSEHEPDTEINSVISRYISTGYLPPAVAGAQFADLSDTLDFDKAQDKILKARTLFLDLPIDVKDEFRTADELLKAFHSPKGVKKLQDLGLLSKPVKQEPAAPVAGSGVQPQGSNPSPVDVGQAAKGGSAS